MTALEFLRKFADGHRIVSSNDLCRFAISEAQANGHFFYDVETGYGWAAIPWCLTTEKDRKREFKYFQEKDLEEGRQGSEEIES